MSRRRISRRDLLKHTLLGTTAMLVPVLAARAAGPGVPWLPGQTETPPAYPHLRFFTHAERQCVDAITARLIPSDGNGPGARDAGVTDFIDSQLAGFYGRGDRWYMKGPFRDGLDTQGYQHGEPPAGLYRKAIESLDAYCRDTAGSPFADLPEAEQDELLKRLDDGELELDGVPAKAFFELVRENAIEGFFSDPIYGGNRDMIGWRLVGFPGARYDYRDYLDHDGRPISIEPVGLKGRPAWNPG